MFAVLRYATTSKRMPGVLSPVWCAKLGSSLPSSWNSLNFVPGAAALVLAPPEQCAPRRRSVGLKSMRTWSRLAKCTDALPLASPQSRRDPRHKVGILGRSSAALRQRATRAQHKANDLWPMGKHSCVAPQLFTGEACCLVAPSAGRRPVAGSHVCCDPSAFSLTAMPHGLQRISRGRLHLAARLTRLCCLGWPEPFARRCVCACERVCLCVSVCVCLCVCVCVCVFLWPWARC